MDSLKSLRHLMLICASIFLLAACERDIHKISDQELIEKRNECMSMNDPAPAMIFACENYKRECKRRRELGRFLCI